MTSDNLSATQCALLNKSTVQRYLDAVKQALVEIIRQDRKAVKVLYQLNVLINQSECCVLDWMDVSNLYQSAACTLEKSLEFLGNGVFQDTKSRIEVFYKAHKFAEPFVLNHLLGDGDFDKLQELGF